jgi:hypothetical protein
VTLDAGASFSSYIWSSGEATRTIEVGRSGLYFVKVTNAAGCEGISDSVRITVHPPPPVPLIKRAGDTLFTTARATSYRWMLDGSEISGAVFSRIVIALPGLYTVTITDSNGCSSKSAPYILTDADAAQSGLYSPILEAYPQPGETFIAIRVGNISPCEHLLILSDVLGRSVLRRRYAAGRANIDDTFDISRLPKGFYHLRISGGRDVAATKIMIK